MRSFQDFEIDLQRQLGLLIFYLTRRRSALVKAPLGVLIRTIYRPDKRIDQSARLEANHDFDI